MRRFFLEKNSVKEGKAIIRGSEAKHIGKVLRLGVGDTLYLLDENGWEYQAAIISKSSKLVEVELLKKSPPRDDPLITVVLGQALPKAKKMDFIVQKATELGVSTIIPFFSERTIPSLDDDQLKKRHIRWKRIALEATKQCGRLVVPHIEEMLPFKEILKEWSDNYLKIILWEDEKNIKLKQVLSENQPHQRIIILIGPEGGFTAEEVDMARQAGFKSVSLGKYILRTETVGLCLLNILQYEWGEMG